MLYILKGLNDDFHACSSCQQFLLLTHGEFLKLASAVTWQSNGSDFTGHNGSPRNGLCHRCALKFESHNCCTPPWSQSEKSTLKSGHEKTRCAVLLGILSCPLGFSAFRLFLRSLQPILAAAQAFRLDLIQRILQVPELQPP